MRILVTGATGFLGSRLVPKLVEDGQQILALARSVSSHDKLKALGASPVNGDLESGASLSLPTVDAVVHAAARFRFSGPRSTFIRTNVDGTVALLQGCRNRWSEDIRLYQRGGCRHGRGGCTYCKR